MWGTHGEELVTQPEEGAHYAHPMYSVVPQGSMPQSVAVGQEMMMPMHPSMLEMGQPAMQYYAPHYVVSNGPPTSHGPPHAGIVGVGGVLGGASSLSVLGGGNPFRHSPSRSRSSASPPAPTPLDAYEMIRTGGMPTVDVHESAEQLWRSHSPNVSNCSALLPFSTPTIAPSRLPINPIGRSTWGHGVSEEGVTSFVDESELAGVCLNA